MIILGRGTDCTALFQCYHPSFPLERLHKYEVHGRVSEAPTVGWFSYDPDAFFHTVRSKVYDQLERRGVPRKAGAAEWLILALHLCLYTMALIKGVLAGIVPYTIAFGILRGLIYVRPLHAASHYELHERPRPNRLVTILCACLAGSVPDHWAVQHVRDHHGFPNMYPIDNDALYPVKIILPHMKTHWWTPYQHLYIPIIFSIASLNFFVNDAIRILIETVKSPHSRDLREKWFVILVQAGLKALPFAFHDLGTAVLIILLAEVTTSVFVISQTVVNHELAETTQRVPRQGEDWGAWQMHTAHNWRAGNALANAISGGLNHQIEHHLFPEIHYRHYPWISAIVRREAREFGVPYYESGTLSQALRRHFVHLSNIAHS